MKRLATGALIAALTVSALSQKTFAYECLEAAQQTVLMDETGVGPGMSLPLSNEKELRVTAFTRLRNGAFILCLDDKKTVIAYGQGERDEISPAEEMAPPPTLSGQLDRLATVGFSDEDILKALIDKFDRITSDHDREEEGILLIQEIRNMLATIALSAENDGPYIQANTALWALDNMRIDSGTALQTVALVYLFEELAGKYPRNDLFGKKLRRTIRWKIRANALEIKAWGLSDTTVIVQENRWLLEKLFEFHRRWPSLTILYDGNDDLALFRSINPEIARDLEELDRLQKNILEYKN